jgi:hypothetical protein
MVRVANTILTDTFDTWRVNTNKLAHIIEEMDGGNATDGGTEPYAGNVHATSLVSNNLIVHAGGNTGISGYVNFANATQVVFKTSDIRIRGAANNSVYTRSNILKLKATADGQVEWGNIGFNEIANTLSSSQFNISSLPDGLITSTKISTKTIQANNIADAAITSTQIAADTIQANNIATSAVTTAEILDKTIATGDIADAAITSTKIAADTIQANNIATSAVTTAEILDKTIVAGDLADAAVTSTKIAATTIEANNINTGAITAGKIATGGVSSNVQLAAGVVTSHAVAAEAIGNTHIKDGGIAVAKLAGSTGTSARIANVQYFHTSGIQTWTKPSNVDTVQAIVIGGGGGGMDYQAAGPLSPHSAGAMGGMAMVTVESLSNPVRVVVGAGGSAGGTSGGTGGTSLFGPPTPNIDPVGSPTIGAYATATGGFPGPSASGLLSGIGTGNTSTTTVAIAGRRTTPMVNDGWRDISSRSAAHGGSTYMNYSDETNGLDPTRVFRNMGAGGSGGQYSTAYSTPGGDESPGTTYPASSSPGTAGANGGVVIIGYHNES